MTVERERFKRFAERLFDSEFDLNGVIGTYKSLKVLLLLIQASVEVVAIVVCGLFCGYVFEVLLTQALVRVTAAQTARLTIKNWPEAIHINELYFECSTILLTVV